MIKTLSIKNFKSIKELSIETTRVNVFIGEHNSGKSNILEALSWFSVNALHSDAFRGLFRFKNTTDLFYDFVTSDPIEILTDDLSLFIRNAKSQTGAVMDHFEGFIYLSAETSTKNPKDLDLYNISNAFSKFIAFRLHFDGKFEFIRPSFLESSFRTYIFKRLDKFQKGIWSFLNPPFGDNIPSLVLSNREFRERIGSIFKGKGFRLILNPADIEMNMAKDTNDELYVYPYQTISETLQRIIFYVLAIESNTGATLVIDEPESNTFPMYTKQLAELIAFDAANQYFISTHNPYILDSLVSKTPTSELSVFVTEMKNYQTSVNKISDERLSVLLDKGIDVYFNLDKLTEE